MHIDNALYSLTPTEQFGFTPPAAYKMCEWNHSKDNPFLGAVASRIVGFVIIPFSEIVDAFTHLGIASLKGVIGIIVLPYNSLALIFSSERTVRTDFELSSSLIHLWLVVECLFGAAIFPFICLLNPDAAFRCMGYRLAFHEDEIAALNREIRDLNVSSARLRQELTQANQDLVRARNNATRLQPVDNIPDLHLLEKNQKQELEIQKVIEANSILDQNCSNLRMESSRLGKELQLLQGRSHQEKQALSIQIDQLNVKLDEEQKLSTTIQSLKTEMAENNSKNASIVLGLENKISEMDKEIQDYKKNRQDTKTLREKAALADKLTTENISLILYRDQNENELAKLRKENNDLRDAQSLGGQSQNEAGTLIRSPSKHGF